jgi:hypothetical protein
MGARDGSDDELRNALVRFYRDGMLSEIDQDDFDLATIIGINGAGRIQNSEPFFQCPATSGTHLPLKPGRYFDCNSSRDGVTGERCKDQRLVQRCNQVNARGVLALITRHGSTQALNLDDWNNQAKA